MASSGWMARLCNETHEYTYMCICLLPRHAGSRDTCPSSSRRSVEPLRRGHLRGRGTARSS
eukprot:2648694-Lingulodinium_polyedra.AAC.1